MALTRRWASDLVPVAALVGVSFALPGSVLVSAATGIAGSLAAPFTQRGYSWCCRRFLRPGSVVNNDLQRALQRAFRDASWDLEHLWMSSHQRDILDRRSGSEDDPEVVKALFADMRSDAAEILSDAHLVSILQSAEALDRWNHGVFTLRLESIASNQESKTTHRKQTMGERSYADSLTRIEPVRIAVGGEQDVLSAYLAPYLEGHNEQLVRFLHRSFASQLSCRFGEELKSSDLAWRAYERLVWDSLQEGVQSLETKQDTTQATLERILQQIKVFDESQKAKARNPEILNRLDAAISTIRNQLIYDLSVQFELTRAEIKSQFDGINALVVEEAEKTRNHDTSEQEATRHQINTVAASIVKNVMEGIDRRLEAQSRAAPPIHSRVWSVPYQWSRYFVGRDSLIERIHAQFSSNPYPVSLVQAIQGLGGVGKTQLALHYAYRYSSDYAGIWWLPAESASTLGERYAALANWLDLPAASIQDQRQRIEAVRRYLEETEETGERWLLIFDNAVPTTDLDPSSGNLDDYLPRRGRCDVLLTSRERAWSHLAEEQDVNVLCEGDAVRFLVRRTGDHDQKAARQLAHELGYLPLALEQAGAFIRESHQQHTLESYLHLYRRTPLDRLAFDHARTGAYNDVVATTWSISFETVERLSSASGDLLRLCAFFAPERIPLRHLVEHVQHLPEHSPLQAALQDARDGPRAISLLLRYSLAEFAGERMINMHRLVQLVIREWLDDDERKSWAKTALNIVGSSFDYSPGDQRQGSKYGDLLDHARSTISFADDGAADPPEAIHLLRQVGHYLRDNAQYGDAQSAFQKALTLSEYAFGPNSRMTGGCLSGLAGVLLDQGDSVGAKGRYLQALAIAESLVPSDAREVAASLGNLAIVLTDRGELEEARDLAERSVELMSSAVLDPDPLDVSGALSLLARVMSAQGDYAGAQERFERALELREKNLDSNHPDVARSLSNMAGVLRNRGDLVGAKEGYERSLAIREEVLLPDHPEVARTLSNLAGVLQDQGDLEGAKERYERALAMLERVFGPEHPHVATVLNNIADVLAHQGDLAAAREQYERALAILQKFYGPEHPHVGKCLNNLALVLRNQDDVEAARTTHERALAILEESLGPEHPDVAWCLSKLALVLQMQDEMETARTYNERALAILEKAFGPNDAKVAKALLEMGDASVPTGRLAEAEAAFLRAWRISLTLPNPEYESGSLLRLGAIADMEGRGEDGLKLLILSVLLNGRSQSGPPDEIYNNLSYPWSLSARLGYDEPDFYALIDEMSHAYRVDRGRRFVAAAFPNPHLPDYHLDFEAKE